MNVPAFRSDRLLHMHPVTLSAGPQFISGNTELKIDTLEYLLNAVRKHYGITIATSS